MYNLPKLFLNIPSLTQFDKKHKYCLGIKAWLCSWNHQKEKEKMSSTKEDRLWAEIFCRGLFAIAAKDKPMICYNV